MEKCDVTLCEKKKIYSDHGKIKKKKIIFFSRKPRTGKKGKRKEKEKEKEERKEEKRFDCVKGNKQTLKKVKRDERKKSAR